MSLALSKTVIRQCSSRPGVMINGRYNVQVGKR